MIKPALALTLFLAPTAAVMDPAQFQQRALETRVGFSSSSPLLSRSFQLCTEHTSAGHLRRDLLARAGHVKTPGSATKKELLSRMETTEGRC